MLFRSYAAHGQGLDVSVVAMLMKPSGYCMAASAENLDLQQAAGDVLTNLVSNGTIDVIERKWLGASVALDGLTVIGDGSAPAGDTGSDQATADDNSGSASDGDNGGDTGTDGDNSGDGDSGNGDSGNDSSDGPDEEGE